MSEVFAYCVGRHLFLVVRKLSLVADAPRLLGDCVRVIVYRGALKVSCRDVIAACACFPRGFAACIGNLSFVVGVCFL